MNSVFTILEHPSLSPIINYFSIVTRENIIKEKILFLVTMILVNKIDNQ